MFRHILVPLDGSLLAEAALPAASAIASRLGASITLIHVIERNAPDTVHSQRHLRTVEEAEAYLAETARKEFPAQLRVETHVHTAATSDVARCLFEHTDELDPDLIVMCTHGRGGPRDLVFGTIAQQVVALGATPVLLIRPEVQDRARGFLSSAILVPLDQNPEHACCLPFAAGLASSFGVPLQLLTVIPTADKLTGEEAATGRLLPGATRLLLEMHEEQALESLEEHAQRLREARLEVSARVVRDNPAAGIVAAAAHIDAGLIVMGVHGTLGSVAFWERSVPPKVTARTQVPVLFVPIPCR